MTGLVFGTGFSKQRLPALDGLRGIAAIMVMLFHYLPCAAQGTLPNSPVRLFSHLFMTGWSGVDLFLVLSGFLISGILIDNCNAKNYWSVFYTKRAFRILPIYSVLVAGYFLAVHIGLPAQFRDSVPWWGYATFTQNIVMAYRDQASGGVLGVTWSLSVEEQFYLLIPVAVRLLSRRQMMAFTVASIAAIPVLRMAPMNETARMFLTPCRADGLMIGVLLALVVRDTALFGALASRPKTILACMAFTGLGAASLLVKPGILWVFNYSVVASFFGLTILATLAGGEKSVLNRVLTLPALRWIGTISYGLYLYHQTVSLTLHYIILGHAPNIATMAGLAVTAVAMVASIGVAALSFYLCEQPILNWAKRFRYSPHHGRSALALAAKR